MTIERRRYRTPGKIAITPEALTIDFAAIFAAPEPYIIRGSTAVVSVRGPVDFSDEWFLTYAALLDRAWSAFADPQVQRVALDYDSPGGSVRGMFSTAKALRQLADESRKEYVSYVSGDCCSATYCTAASADRIILKSEDSAIGSIGVKLARWDDTAALAQEGLRVVYCSSSPDKLWGDPHVTPSVEELSSYAREVESDAAQFVAWVAERRGISVEAVRSLGALVVYGSEAIRLGLADAIGESIDSPATVIRSALPAGLPGVTMALTDIITALGEIAQGESDEAAAAQRMLAAVEPPAEPTKEDDEDEDEELAAAESTPGATVSASTAAAIGADFATQLSAMQSKLDALEARDTESQRSALFEAHAVPQALQVALAKTPISEVRAIVSALPKSAAKPGLGTLKVTPTANSQPAMNAAQRKLAARVSEKMGLSAASKARTNKIIAGARGAPVGLFIDVPENFQPSEDGE